MLKISFKRFLQPEWKSFRRISALTRLALLFIRLKITLKNNSIKELFETRALKIIFVKLKSADMRGENIFVRAFPT